VNQRSGPRAPFEFAAVPGAGYACALAAVAVATASGTLLTWLWPSFSLANLAMLYLLATTMVAYRFGLRPSILAAALGVACFDFIFVPPRWTFNVVDTQYFITFGVMLAVGLVVGTLTDRLRAQAEMSRIRDAESHRVRVEAEMEKLRSALLSSVSHDLRTPLSVISGTAQTLLSRPETPPESVRVMLQGIHDEAARLTRLVSNLLDITRLESGAVELNRQWVSLEEVIGSTLRHLDAALSGRHVKLEVPANLPLVHADGVLLEQLLYNLLENVVRYAPAGSPVAVSATRDGAGVLVCVDDEGPGFTPGEEIKVFEKFYRGLTARSERGAGLGLTICRAVVAIHRGRIRAENRPSGGARVSFWIPAGDAPPPEVKE
jgi:two-component system, OmpR family, sensor histidine kinase KdpD